MPSSKPVIQAPDLSVPPGKEVRSFLHENNSNTKYCELFTINEKGDHDDGHLIVSNNTLIDERRRYSSNSES